MIDTKLADEAARLAALRRYEILDTLPEAPFDRITGLVKAVFEVPIALVSLIDADRQWLKSCVGMDVSETPREISFCTHTIQRREPMVIANATEDPRFANNPLVTGPPYIASYLGAPLETPDGYNVGSLCAIDTKPRTFSANQIEVMKSFAALVMNEMELRRIAQVDFLTGVATRRRFCLELEKAISRFKRHGRVSALLTLDIDHFKQVNDTYGHPAGDQVLRAVGASLERLVRVNDVVGRLGGEEFGILLADADLQKAPRCAERFRAAIEALVVEHDPPLRVTASFGIAGLEDRNTTAEQWLATADEALYEAKRSGRNRACVAPQQQVVGSGK
jgi:diguanylate cyclase (GGDEF)-like protein